MEFLSTFVGKVLDFIVVPVGRQFGYVLFYGTNIKGLNKEAKKLKAARKDVESKVGAAQNNNEVISETVQLWRCRVDEIIEKAERFFEEDSHANSGCSHKSCPNLWLRYKLSREAKKMAAEVDHLRREWNFDRISTHQMLPQGIGDSSTVSHTFESRVSTMNEIMEALADPAVHLIGLYGLGGVGKTTLAKEVAKKARDEKLFDRVLFVEVKHNQIKEIRGQIADMLGLKLGMDGQSGFIMPNQRLRLQQEIQDQFADMGGLKFGMQCESEFIRANQLRLRMQQETSILIVLDDLWKRLDFDQVGIPFVGKGNTHCKFILTSRNVDLLSAQMNCKRNIMVGLLSEEDAWVLFKEMAEIKEHFDDPDLVSKAAEVAQKCAGLPIAIVAVARALRNNKSLVDWKDALRRLNSYSSRNISGIEEVDSSIKLSYDYLRRKELKCTFLLSAMFSQGPSIAELFMYAVGLGFLEGVDNMEVARDRLDALISQLKASSLLLDSYSKDRFTIHDVVRDVALSIAFEEQHSLVKRREELDDWPNEYQPESCTAICLDESDIDELPEELYGPKVDFFYLNSKDIKLNIPSNFFKGMQELKVLSLSNMTFSSLPSSISLLNKLITLSLHSCTLEDITVVEHLKKLKILNLSHSKIRQLPCEVGQLSYLKILNLSHCYRLEVIPPNILSKLKRLEELYIGHSIIQWKAEGLLNEGKERASVKELKDLQKLTALEITIPDASVLPKDLFMENSLERYKISIGTSWLRSYNNELSRALRLGGAIDNTNMEYAINNTNMEYGIFKLLKSVEDLDLEFLNGIASLHQNYITTHTFCKLRTIKVSYCDQLKSLFSVSMVGMLSRLERIEVSNCKSLEEIVAYVDEEKVEIRSAMNVIVFPQLHFLKLDDLPALTSFCFNSKEAFPKLESLSIANVSCHNIWDVPTSTSNRRQISEIAESSRSRMRIMRNNPLLDQAFSNLKTLKVTRCKFLLKLIPLPLLKCLSNLEELEVSRCVSLEVVFDFEEFNNYEENHAFGLKRMLLSFLPNLKAVWGKGSQGIINFQNLQKLVIQNCNKLEIFQAELPDTKYSSFLDEKVIPNLEVLQLEGRHAKMIWNDKLRACRFLNVKVLSLSGIYDKAAAFPYGLFCGFPKLEQLGVSYSYSEVIFFCPERPLDDDTRKATSINRLMLCSMTQLKYVWDGKCHLNHILQNLKTLQVYFCDRLINLGPSIVSLENLRDLDVSDCDGMVSLLTPSTARTLVQLTTLKITRCKNMEEIITNGEEDLENEIVFVKLKILELRQLPRFKSFCCPNYTFHLPPLDKVTISECPIFRMNRSLNV